VRAALVIAWKDLRQRIRDRSALLLVFFGPILLASIVSGAFGSGFSNSDFSATYLVVDHDRTALSKAFVRDVLQSKELRDQVTVRLGTSDDEARRITSAGQVAAAFVIPKGFERSIGSQRPSDIGVLRSADSPIGAEIGEALARAFAAQINAARLSVATTLSTQQVPDLGRIPALAAQAARERIPVSLELAQTGGRDVSGANYFGPAMAIFFVFFTVGFGARSLLAEREQGTMARLLGAPVARWSVIAGKALAVYVLGLASMATTFLFMGLVFGVRWGDPLALAVLTLLIVLAAMGVTAVVQTFAKTEEQASAFGTMVSVTLAILGGNFFPLFQLPRAIQYLSLGTPNGWALRGFTDVAYDGAGLGDLTVNILAIAAFAVVTCSIALRRARKVTLA
jgi:ABC-2 type transport system permease protein